VDLDAHGAPPARHYARPRPPDASRALPLHARVDRAAGGATLGPSRRGTRGGRAVHARVTRVQAAPGHLGEVAHLLRYSLLPALRAAPGFLRTELLVAPAAGRCLTVTYWATPAALEASAARTVAGMLASALVA